MDVHKSSVDAYIVSINEYGIMQPMETIADISGSRNKSMKATNEQVLAAVDGEMCKEQAEKLRTICSYMDTPE